MNNTQQFTPDWVSAPGDTIKDLLEERGIGIQDFAGRIGKSSDFVNALLIGQESIDEGLAQLLEQSLGGPAKFWMNREQDYREDLGRLNKEWLAAKFTIEKRDYINRVGQYNWNGKLYDYSDSASVSQPAYNGWTLVVGHPSAFETTFELWKDSKFVKLLATV